MSSSNDTAPLITDDARGSDVEVIELGAISGRRRNALLGRLFLLVAIAVLAGLVAIAGLPGRSSFSLNNPLPNLLQQQSQ